MAGLVSAIDAVVDRFQSVTVDGNPLRVYTDPGDINPPCVFLPLPDIAFQYSKGYLIVSWTAYLIAPNAPRIGTVTEHLARIIDAVTGIYPFTAGAIYALNMQGGGIPTESYRLEWAQRITIGA